MSRWGSPRPESSKDGVPGERRRRPAARAAMCSRTGQSRSRSREQRGRGVSWQPGGAPTVLGEGGEVVKRRGRCGVAAAARSYGAAERCGGGC